MPALANPRHERFAQLIFVNLCNGESKAYSTSRAYIAAGYSPKGAFERGGSAQTSSSRLLYRVLHRVRELQAEAAEHTKESADKIIRELNELKREAQAKEAYGPAVSAVMGKVKVLGIVDKPVQNELDFKTAKSMQDIGRKLLMSVGFREPDDVSIQLAIEANDAFVAELERIRDAAQGPAIDQDQE
jgi:hypothetical protein